MATTPTTKPLIFRKGLDMKEAVAGELAAAIAAHHDNCLAAAQALGIHRTTLRRKLDQLDL